MLKHILFFIFFQSFNFLKAQAQSYVPAFKNLISNYVDNEIKPPAILKLDLDSFFEQKDTLVVTFDLVYDRKSDRKMKYFFYFLWNDTIEARSDSLFWGLDKYIEPGSIYKVSSRIRTNKVSMTLPVSKDKSKLYIVAFMYSNSFRIFPLRKEYFPYLYRITNIQVSSQ